MSGYVSGKTSLTTVQTGDIAADAVTSAKIAADAVTLAKLAAGTDGNLISYDTSGDPAAVATGSSAQVLTSNGAGAAPTFQAAGKGITSITNTTLSDTDNIDFTGFASGTYDNYMVIISNGRPGTDNTLLEIETSTDGGSSYDTGSSDYRWGVSQVYMNGTPQDAGDIADTEIQLTGAQGQGSAAGEHVSFRLMVYLPEEAEFTTFTWEGIMSNVNGDRLATTGAGWRMEAADVDAIRFHWSSGNWAAVGKIQFLGIAH